MILNPRYAAASSASESEKLRLAGSGTAISGLRYYSPTLGRLINKDPIEESGGLNLYAFVRNDAINGWDYLGMSVGTQGRFDLLFEEQGNSARFSGGGAEGSLAWAASTGLGVVTTEMDSLNNSIAPSATNSGNWVQNMVARGQQAAIQNYLSANGVASTTARQVASFVVNNGWEATMQLVSLAERAIATSAAASSAPASVDADAENRGALSVELRIAFEEGVSDRRVALSHVSNLQGALDSFSEAAGLQQIDVRVSVQRDSIAKPTGGEWVQSPLPSAAVNRVFTEVLRTSPSPDAVPVIFASSQVKNAWKAPVAGLGGPQGVIISPRADAWTLTHEWGHVIGWNSNGAAHTRDKSNIMNDSGYGGTIDQQFYERTMRRTRPWRP